MDQDATWHGGRPRPRRGHIVLEGDPAPRPPKRDTVSNFRPMSVVAKRSVISATVEHLYADLDFCPVISIFLLSSICFPRLISAVGD